MTNKGRKFAQSISKNAWANVLYKYNKRVLEAVAKPTVVKAGLRELCCAGAAETGGHENGWVLLILVTLSLDPKVTTAAATGWRVQP